MTTSDRSSLNAEVRHVPGKGLTSQTLCLHLQTQCLRTVWRRHCFHELGAAFFSICRKAPTVSTFGSWNEERA